MIPPVIRAVEQTPDQRAVSEAHAQHVIISTQGRVTTQIAKGILQRGGNLVDAAIAASFAIGVERPHSTGIGGGGFMLFRDAATGKVHVLDFRERAPSRANAEVFLRKDGSVTPLASVEGIRSVAVPGFLKAMVELHRKFGKLPLEEVIEPAANLADSGVKVYPDLAEAISEKRDLLARFPESRKIFLHKDGTPYQLGEKLVQRDLARTLRWLARASLDEWVISEFNEKIAGESIRRKGLLTMSDLSRYSTRWLDPLLGGYKDYQIISMPPPSGGGFQVVETLNILDHFGLSDMTAQSAPFLHLFASASQLVFADRSQYLGDPAFIRVPMKDLTSKGYSLEQSQRIDLNHHTPSDVVNPGRPTARESTSTTHFSMMDDQGNVIVSTQTINGSFGSGIVVRGLGVVLNDEMDDFSAKPGVENMYGAVGGDANSIAPGKTPLSSMAPTIVIQNNKPVLALGAPGGTRIGSCVAEVALNFLQFKMSLYDAVSAFRIHHQWKPDILNIEAPGPSAAAFEVLRKDGYAINLAPKAVPCRVMAVARDSGGFVGVSDPRDDGASAGF
ncbi:MAG: gamma-glutamyltransferase [Oligoflexia bacterium]|nr:gamma-glutamyltransferase [Oligoflexia bacterium]